MFAYRTSV